MTDDTMPTLSCPTCAAQFSRQVTTSTQSCPYCGTCLQSSGVTSKQNMPQSVVSFTIARDQLDGILAKHVASSRLARKDFAPKIELASSVYVPYYLHDVEVWGEVGFRGRSKSGYGKNRSIYFHYNMRVLGHMECKGIPAYASSHAPRNLVENIAPFDITHAFTLGPFWEMDGLVELPTEPTAASVSHAENLAYESFLRAAREHMEDSAVGHVSEPNNWFVGAGSTIKVIPEGEPYDRGHHTSVTQSQLIALPIWLLRCTWEGRNYAFAINGQTGTCAGNLPIDETKLIRTEIWTPLLTRGVFISLPFLAALFLVPVNTALSYATAPQPALMALTIAEILILLVSLLALFVPSHLLKDKKARQEQIINTQVLASRTGEKATDSLAIQLKQRAYFTMMRVEEVPSTLMDSSKPKKVVPKKDARNITMLVFASELCDKYNQKAIACGYGTGVRNACVKSFVPPEEDTIAVYDSYCGNNALKGFAISDTGIRYRIGKGEMYFTAWEEYAWSGVPSQKWVRGQLVFYSSGSPIAHAPQNPILQDELFRLFVSLQQKAHEVFEWEYIVSTRTMTAASIVMADVARTTCKSIQNMLPKGDTDKESILRNLLNLGSLEEYLLLYDDSKSDHEECAFAITTSGFICRERNDMDVANHTSWSQLSQAPAITRDGENIRAGKVAIACYRGDDSVADALYAMCKKLHAMAREVFRSRTALYLYHR